MNRRAVLFQNLGLACILSMVVLGINHPVVAQINQGQLLVLKNGEVFRGRVTEGVNQFTVETLQGSRLILKRDKVDFVSRSFEEAYWEKAAATSASDDDGQVALFRWCLKHQLLLHAENQLSILTQSQLKASELHTLSRQLKAAHAQRETAEASLASQRPQRVDGNSGEIAFSPLPQLNNPGREDSKRHIDGAVQRVAYESSGQSPALRPPGPNAGWSPPLTKVPQPTAAGEITPVRPSRLETIGEIPKLSRSNPGLRQGFVPVDEFDPEIFNRMQRERASNPDSQR